MPNAAPQHSLTCSPKVFPFGPFTALWYLIPWDKILSHRSTDPEDDCPIEYPTCTGSRSAADREASAEETKTIAVQRSDTTGKTLDINENPVQSLTTDPRDVETRDGWDDHETEEEHLQSIEILKQFSAEFRASVSTPSDSSILLRPSITHPKLDSFSCSNEGEKNMNNWIY